MWDLAGLPQPDAVQVEVGEFRYDTAKRSLTLRVKATNTSGQPVLLRKFTTSYLSFINEETQGLYPGPPDQVPTMLVWPNGLIEPSQTADLTITIQDAVWETDRFIEFDQPQITAAGMLVFTTNQPLSEEGMEPMMLGNSLEGPGVPWTNVASINEIYSNLQIAFGKLER